MTTTISGTGGITTPSITSSAAVKSANGITDIPAFSAYQNAIQSIPHNTATKLQLQAKDFDTTSAFDNVTNYRFQPAVAGYYQFNGAFSVSATNSGFVEIVKNGVSICRGTQAASASTYGFNVSALVYLNGTTDYIELFGYQVSGGALNTNTFSGPRLTYLQGFLVRAA